MSGASVTWTWTIGTGLQGRGKKVMFVRWIILHQKTSGWVNVWCPPRERLRPDCLTPSVLLALCFHFQRKGSLQTNTKLFCMIPFILRWNTSRHRKISSRPILSASIVDTGCFYENASDVNQSPDLNPVENLCESLYHYVRDHSSPQNNGGISFWRMSSICTDTLSI